MNQHNSTTNRQEMILFAAVAEYVATGKPVSSGALAEKLPLPLSSAAIRRHLQALTEKGLLVQPHTSAGRVPSDQGFRRFVDALQSEGAVDPLAQKKLTHGVGNLNLGTQSAWRNVARILSEVASQTALMVTPALNDAVLKQLRFIPIAPTRLLAVVVTREELVHNVYIDTDAAILGNELERIHNCLEELVGGHSLREIRGVLRKELEDARKRQDEFTIQATLLGSQAIESSVRDTTHVVVEGHSHLLIEPAIKENADDLLRMLDEKTQLLDLLDRAAQSDRGPLILIGQEGGAPLDGCAIVSFPFGSDQTEGRIGVIGPTRMNYSSIIPLVSLSAEELSRVFDRTED